MAPLSAPPVQRTTVNTVPEEHFIEITYHSLQMESMDLCKQGSQLDFRDNCEKGCSYLQV